MATGLRGQNGRVFERAYERGDWVEAAKAAELWAKNDPTDTAAAYNAACAFALSGDTEAALEWLRRAGVAGFAGVRSIEEDPDLAAVRGGPGFAEATATIRVNRARMFAGFKEAAESSEILTIPPPRGSEGPRPLIVVLHGYGGEARSNAEMFQRVAKKLGAIVAAPNALRPGPAGQGFSWTYRDEAEWWVLRTIERVSAQQPVDPARVILAGFSQGANVALGVGLKYPERFVGLLPIAGRYDVDRMPTLEGAGPRVYLLVGGRDRGVESFRAAEKRLSEAGLEVRLRVVPGLGHYYPQRATRELGKALEFLLRP
jgi:predicted esterase